MRSSSGPLSRRRWRARSAPVQRQPGPAPDPAGARVGGRDEHAPAREGHEPLPADDRHPAVLERLAQRLQAVPGELGELVEE